VGIAKRIKRIVSANINDLIEKAEDPETMVDQLIREMDESTISLRAEVARTIATENRITLRLEDARKQVRTWQESSEKAVRDGNDNIARKAIAEKLEAERRFAELETQHKEASGLSRMLKGRLLELEGKTEEVRRKKETLVARKRSAQSQKKILSATESFVHISPKDHGSLSETETQNPFRFESLEDEVMQVEAEAEALKEVTTRKPSLHQVFENSEKKQQVEDQLRELKEKLKA